MRLLHLTGYKLVVMTTDVCHLCEGAVPAPHRCSYYYSPREQFVTENRAALQGKEKVRVYGFHQSSCLGASRELPLSFGVPKVRALIVCCYVDDYW
jgi:hypothetical protein